MKPSQIAWLVSLVAFVCTAMIGQAELLGEPWRHFVTIVSVMATAISGFMLQHPWGGEERRDGQTPTYIVVQNGVGTAMTQAAVEAHLKDAAADLPQPLPIHERL